MGLGSAKNQQHKRKDSLDMAKEMHVVFNGTTPKFSPKINKVLADGAIIVPLLGPGGCGKDTKGRLLQDLLSSYRKTYIINTKEMIEYHIRMMTAWGAQFLEARQKKDGLTAMAPDKPVLGMLEEEIIMARESGHTIIKLNSAPRSTIQADAFISLPTDNLRGVFFKSGRETAHARAAERREKALLAGLEPRADDDPREVEKRWVEYKHNASVGIKRIHAHDHRILEVVDSTWPIRRQLTHVLRHLVRDKRQFKKLCGVFDDNTHPVTIAISEIENSSINGVPGETPTIPLQQFTRKPVERAPVRPAFTQGICFSMR